ncbi:hypothetical protein P9273_29410 [Mesorhizobium sp. WSM4935]|uniref:NACHT domain-containing protein n=1 Tax=Mesorhizobium sp. WSM4935 TaxID=3038547 RepID=UPI002415651B|nr:hypothetical protein [Mesorhizobium sp. WSM4935]MDG4879201.1 hypothetical protein [Mesorhizobium sp. WSM4935]
MTIIGEMALGVASNILFDAIRRPFQALTAELRRKDRVNKALTDRQSVRPSGAQQSEKALHDLTRIIGNSHGNLDENVSEFLRELKKTVIPEALANCALSGASPESLFAPFDEFYSRFSDLHFTSRQLFDGLFAACVERVDAVEDAALLEIIRAQHHELLEKVNQVRSSLQMQGKAGPLSYSEIRDARVKVARSIDAANRYTTVETLQGTKKLRLRNLAIHGRLTPLSPAEIASAKIGYSDQSIGYITFRRQFDRAVILGDPGGGKSTLTQMLCNDLASLIVLEDSNPGRKEYDPQELKVPLRIVLRSFEARQRQDPSYTFFDYLRDDLIVALENDDGLAGRFLQVTLAMGAAILIFDGLDEVLEVGERRNIVGLIEQFAEIYAGCPVLVTSRLVGYRDAPLCEDFEVFGLARFSPEEVSKYCAKSIRAVSGESLKVAAEKSKEFLRQTSKIGGDLRENPLMLGLMVQIFVYRGDVPSNRPEVYKECATLMFEKWDGRRDIVVQKVPRDDMELLDVFGYVASRTFGDAANEEGVSKQWLTQELRTHFEDWYVDRASAHRAAKSLVDFLTGRAWVMSEVGSGTFKFTHRTFLEYFFARNLISLSSSISELVLERLIPHVIKNEWVVISHLALHMAVFRDSGKARQAGEGILTLLSESSIFPADQELPLLEFVAGALDYLIIPEAMYLAIVERLIMRAVKLGSRENAGAISVVWTIFQTAKSRLALTTKATEGVFERHLHGTSSPEMLFCMYVLGYKQRLLYRFTPIGGRYGNLGVLWDALSHIREKYKTFFESLAEHDLLIAKAFSFLYGERRFQYYRAFGPAFIETSLSPLVPSPIDQPLASAANQVSYALSGGPDVATDDDPDLSDCERLVEAVADDVKSGTIERLLAPIPSASWADDIDQDVEMTVRFLYAGQSRRSSKVRRQRAQVLLSVLILADSLAREREAESHSRRRGILSIPLNVLKALVSRCGETDYTPALQDWMGRIERPERRRPVVRSKR